MTWVLKSCHSHRLSHCCRSCRSLLQAESIFGEFAVLWSSLEEGCWFEAESNALGGWLLWDLWERVLGLCQNCWMHTLRWMWHFLSLIYAADLCSQKKRWAPIDNPPSLPWMWHSLSMTYVADLCSQKKLWALMDKPPSLETEECQTLAPVEGIISNSFRLHRQWNWFLASNSVTESGISIAVIPLNANAPDPTPNWRIRKRDRHKTYTKNRMFYFRGNIARFQMTALSNATFPINWTLSGRLSETILVPTSALDPMETKSDGKLILVRLVQEWKTA